MTETDSKSDLKQISSGGTCRACMLLDDTTRMIFLFESNNNLAEIFWKCTSLETTDTDGLPKHICLNCHNDLVNYNKFRLLCTSSDAHFRQNINIKEENINKEEYVIIEEDGMVEYLDDLQSDSEDCDVIEELTDDVAPLEILCEESVSDDLDSTEDTAEVTAAETNTGNGIEGKVRPENDNEKSTLTCDECGKKFFKRHRLEGHLRQHQGLKPCVCGICGKTFSKWSGLSLHMSGWHNYKSDKKQYPCEAENCDKSYNMKQSLSLHKRKSHSDSVAVQEIKFVCDVCGKPFRTSNALKKHTYTHTGYENMPYSCSVCPKKYTTKHKLKEHTMRHDGIKNHICPFCGLRKTTSHELKVHINYHTREKIFPCKQCNAEFSSIGNMSRHFKIVHCGIKAFTCTICDRSFGKSETLKHHIYTHTGEKPHACSICNKRFIQSIALQTHMKTHNKVA